MNVSGRSVGVYIQCETQTYHIGEFTSFNVSHFQSVVKLGNQKDAIEQCHSNQKHVGSIIAFSGILTRNSVPSHRTEMTRLHPTF